MNVIFLFKINSLQARNDKILYNFKFREGDPWKVLTSMTLWFLHILLTPSFNYLTVTVKIGQVNSLNITAYVSFRRFSAEVGSGANSNKTAHLFYSRLSHFHTFVSVPSKANSSYRAAYNSNSKPDEILYQDRIHVHDMYKIKYGHMIFWSTVSLSDTGFKPHV